MHGSVNLNGLDGVRDIQGAEGVVSFLYSGGMKPLLQRLAEGNVRDLGVSEPDLEEIFLHYYQDGGDEQ